LLRDEDVPLPGGIFEPGQFRAALIHFDDVETAVAVQVRCYQLVAHFQFVRHSGLAPLRQIRAGQYYSKHRGQERRPEHMGYFPGSLSPLGP